MDLVVNLVSPFAFSDQTSNTIFFFFKTKKKKNKDFFSSTLLKKNLFLATKSPILV